MTCPICHRKLDAAVLIPTEGDRRELRGFRCTEAHGGVFLPADFYVEWRDAGETPPVVLDEIPAADEVGDVKRAKLCPQEGRIMQRARVAADDSFWLDRCGTCGGVWFDGDEWEASVEAGLLGQLTRVFTDAWQRAIEAAEGASVRQDSIAEALGARDLARVEAFREWLWAHPARTLVMDRLGERPDEPTPAS